LYTGSYPVYTFVYNAYKNLLTPLFVKVDIVDTDVYNVDISAPNSGGDVSNTSQVRSTYCACIQVWLTTGAARQSPLGASCEDRSAPCSDAALKEDVSPVNDVHCDWALDRTHEVPQRSEGLEASVKLCGRAVADNVKEAGKHFADKEGICLLLARSSMPRS